MEARRKVSAEEKKNRAKRWHERSKKNKTVKKVGRLLRFERGKILDFGVCWQRPFLVSHKEMFPAGWGQRPSYQRDQRDRGPGGGTGGPGDLDQRDRGPRGGPGPGDRRAQGP